MDLGAGKAFCHVADVSDDIAGSAAVQEAKARLGSFDVLVNVAGIMLYREIAELTGDDWRRVLGINLISAALFTGHAFREMKPGGCIVNVASVHARRTMATVAPYAAAKAAMVSLTRSAAIEGAALGIRVNAVLPGAIDTPMLHASPAIKSGTEVLDERDVGQPSDIANVAKFLASNAARFITGEDIVADNGRMGRL
jgi:NAD(P)-dependent dehydrogenase (short-subunit alcohol dehydrogenase family)